MGPSGGHGWRFARVRRVVQCREESSRRLVLAPSPRASDDDPQRVGFQSLWPSRGNGGAMAGVMLVDNVPWFRLGHTVRDRTDGAMEIGDPDGSTQEINMRAIDMNTEYFGEDAEFMGSERHTLHGYGQTITIRPGVPMSDRRQVGRPAPRPPAAVRSVADAPAAQGLTPQQWLAQWCSLEEHL